MKAHRFRDELGKPTRGAATCVDCGVRRELGERQSVTITKYATYASRKMVMLYAPAAMYVREDLRPCQPPCKPRDPHVCSLRERAFVHVFVLHKNRLTGQRNNFWTCRICGVCRGWGGSTTGCGGTVEIGLRLADRITR